MGDLFTLLKSADNLNHKMAVEMIGNFSDKDWMEALQKIAYYMLNDENEGVEYLSNIFKTLENIWFIEYTIFKIGNEWEPYLVYNSTKICLLRDDFRFKYNGKANFKRTKKRLFAAILNQ